MNNNNDKLYLQALLLALLAACFVTLLAMCLGLAGCIATAPVSIAWRSNSSLQHATTEARTALETASPTVNAEKTSATDLKVAKEISTSEDSIMETTERSQ